MPRTADVVLAPLYGANSLYPEPGVDLFDSTNRVEAEQDEHLSWVPFTGADVDFDGAAADALLQTVGYRRTSSWHRADRGEYAHATIERIA